MKLGVGSLEGWRDIIKINFLNVVLKKRNVTWNLILNVMTRTTKTIYQRKEMNVSEYHLYSI